MPRSDLRQTGTLVRRRETQTGVHQLADSGVTSLPEKMEEDRRQQPLGRQAFDGGIATRDQMPGRLQPTSGRGAAITTRAVGDIALPVSGASTRATRIIALASGLFLRDAQKLRVHVRAREQFEQPTSDHHVLVQRNRAALGDDYLDSARTSSSQSPNSSALLTVADSAINCTDSAREMITSSQTLRGIDLRDSAPRPSPHSQWPDSVGDPA